MVFGGAICLWLYICEKKMPKTKQCFFNSVWLSDEKYVKFHSWLENNPNTDLYEMDSCLRVKVERCIFGHTSLQSVFLTSG